jgi:prephenate dehydrogenase
MGGSFALALKRAGLVKRVVGYSKSPSTTERARQMGVIDVEAPSALLAVAGADIVLIAVPVAATEATFKAIKHLVTQHADHGRGLDQARRGRRRAARAARAGRLFVPAHPIAGKEVAGVENADADLYAGRQVILTPIDRTNPVRLQQAVDVWTALGCRRCVQDEPEAHDAAFAAVSHLPHLIAFALMNAISGQPQGKDFLSLAGPGFRDFTRIAASDPTVWRDILLANREELLNQSRIFQRNLQSLELMISSGNADALLEDRSKRPAHACELAHGQSASRSNVLHRFPRHPAAGVRGGSVVLPGSKSISNRVLLLAALCAGHDRGA